MLDRIGTVLFQTVSSRSFRLLREVLELSKIGRVVNPDEVLCLADLAAEAWDLAHAGQSDS